MSAIEAPACDNESAPGRCVNTNRGLTHSLDATKEGLMPDSTCTLPGCDRQHKAHGLCQTHYRRQQRTGITGLRGPEHFFWAKVAKGDPQECWEWLGSRSSTGYGMFRGEKAHRFSARTAGMDIEGRVIRHDCDNPVCVNPAHLRPGTHAENMRDAVERKRMPHGERQRSAKLRAADIPEVLRLSREGLSYRKIGERFGVSKYAIYHVVNGKTWQAYTADILAAGGAR